MVKQFRTSKEVEKPLRGFAKVHDRFKQEMVQKEDEEITLVSPTWNEVQALKQRTGGKYNDEMPGKAYSLLIDRTVCYTKGAIATRLGINEVTLHEWLHKHPEFKHAVDQGLVEQEAFYASKMMNGIKYSQSVIFGMKNLFRWADKIEQTTTLQLGQALAGAAAEGREVRWTDIETKPAALLSDGGSNGNTGAEDQEGEAEADDE
jgi:hypothetical protein